MPELVIDSEFPDVVETNRRVGARTVLARTVDARRRRRSASLIVRRLEVRPFTGKQIALLETFADQAVIAIENVAAVPGTATRNAELREALEHQTATAEVLGIISRSPTDVQPVLDAIVESAAQVCGIDDVVLRLREGNTDGCRGLILVPIPIGHVEIECWMRPRFGWCASTARSTFLTSRQRRFPDAWVSSGNWSAHFGRAPSSARGNSLEH